MKPLHEFYCDLCDQIILSPFEGIIEFSKYIHPNDNKRYIKGFHIVHQAGFSPLNTSHILSCSINHSDQGYADDDLEKFVGDHGLDNLAGLKNRTHSKDYPEFEIFAKRLTIKFYEEVRNLLTNATVKKYFIEKIFK